MRYRETKAKKGSKKDSKFVEKKEANYGTRYKGELSPKSDIVQEPYGASYKSRYK